MIQMEPLNLGNFPLHIIRTIENKTPCEIRVRSNFLISFIALGKGYNSSLSEIEWQDIYLFLHEWQGI